MNKKIRVALTGAVLLAVSACATNRRPPADVPDPGGYTDPNAGTGGGSVGTAVIPGSQADFVASIQSDTIFFDTDMSNIDENDRVILQSQAQWLARYPAVRVTVEGHADERGTREYNLALGERRANSARNYLASLGVDPGRITVVSYGKERPVALGSDEASWAQNRRAVTVTVQR